MGGGREVRGRPFNFLDGWGEGGKGPTVYLFRWVGGGCDFEKQIPASACRKKRIACSTNGIKKILALL